MGRRAAARAATAIAATCALLTACGGSAEPAADQPVEASSTPAPTESSEPASPPPTPKPKPSAKPLSRFEDEAPVKAARAWATAYGTAINDRDESFGSLSAHTTAEGRQRMVGYGAEDAGLFYPGPMPFTPVGVRVEGSTATVPMCMWLEGFALDRKSKQPTKPRLVDGVDMVLKKQGKWKVDAVIVAEGVDCNRVSVKGRGW